MICCQSDEAFSRSFNDASRKGDEMEPEGFHPLRNPRALKDEGLHCRIQIMGKDHDPPPGGILPEIP